MPDEVKRLLQVEIPADVHRELKLAAVRQHTTMRVLVQTAIEMAVLNTANKGPARRHEDR